MAKALMTKVVIMARGLGTGGVRVPCHFHLLNRPPRAIARNPSQIRPQTHPPV